MNRAICGRCDSVDHKQPTAWGLQCMWRQWWNTAHLYMYYYVVTLKCLLVVNLLYRRTPKLIYICIYHVNTKSFNACYGQMRIIISTLLWDFATFLDKLYNEFKKARQWIVEHFTLNVELFQFYYILLLSSIF